MTSTFPFPVNNGYRMRVWSCLRALAAEGHHISLAALAHPGESDLVEDYAGVLDRLDVVDLPWDNGTRDYLAMARAAFSWVPYTVSRFASDEMRRRITDRARYADLLWVETPYAMVNVPEDIGIPVVLNTHNIEHVLLNRYLLEEQNPLRHTYAQMELGKLKGWETHCWQRAAAVLTCSDQDRAVVLEHTMRPISVVPNCIDVDSYTPTPGDDNTVLYSGAMDWSPNRDAVEWFYREIWPHVLAARPQARFVVAGRSAPADYRARFNGSVRFTGTVQDMRDEIGKAAVCVVPTRIGSGTRLKILEAAAMGKAIVSTTVGAEGLHFAHPRNIVLADEPRTFAAEVFNLLEDGAERERLGGQARLKVEESYGFAALRRSIKEALACVPMPDAHGDSMFPLRYSVTG